MAIVVPSILEKTKPEFESALARITGIPSVSRIQVDFADGIFVANTLLGINEIKPLNPVFEWEAHLMIKHPTDFLDYKIAGFKTIIIHYEAFGSEGEIIAALKEIVDLSMQPGLCINPETDIGVLKKFESGVRFMQLMGVHPGFQGTSFLEETYGRLLHLRKLCANAIIEIDGGVNETNIKKLVEMGADLIGAGSVLKKSENAQDEFEKLKSLASF